MYEIKIEWEGPFSINKVIKDRVDGGKKPDWDGEDYGLYQIYGKHILYKKDKDTLLYVGKTIKQTFSRRIKQHKKWGLDNELGIKIYVGRIYDLNKHTKKDGWESWERDVGLAEKILIYKYSPNYNSRALANQPKLDPFKKIHLVHIGKRYKLKPTDEAPKDFE
jgi:hypothetical protein